MAHELNDLQIRATKPREKPYRLGDGDGLRLYATPQGRRLWRLRYTFGGKESMVSLGRYPEVPLAKARDDAADYRTKLAAGTTPAAAKRTERRAHADTFKAVATESLARQPLAAITREKAEWMFNDYLFPFIGSTAVSTLQPAEILEALERIESQAMT